MDVSYVYTPKSIIISPAPFPPLLLYSGFLPTINQYSLYSLTLPLSTISFLTPAITVAVSSTLLPRICVYRMFVMGSTAASIMASWNGPVRLRVGDFA